MLTARSMASEGQPKVAMESVEDMEAKHGDLTAFARQSRKKIRAARKARESDIAERIAHWRDKRGAQTLSRAEVSRHCRATDAWVIVDGVVYDVTGFIEQHPGGPQLLAERAGQDVTETFRDLGHSQLASYILSEMYVGDLPLIECVSGAADSDSDDLSSDEDSRANPVVDMRPKPRQREQEPAAPEPAAPVTAPALAQRHLPARYRKRVPAKGDGAPPEDGGRDGDAGGVVTDSGAAGGQSGVRAGGGYTAGPKQVARAGARGLPRPVPSAWEYTRMSLSSWESAKPFLRDVWAALQRQARARRCALLLQLASWRTRALSLSPSLPPSVARARVVSACARALSFAHTNAQTQMRARALSLSLTLSLQQAAAHRGRRRSPSCRDLALFASSAFSRGAPATGWPVHL